MRIPVQKWGNSLAVRIPKPVAVECGLAEGAVIEMKLVKGKLVLAPAHRPKYELEELLASVTKRNLHKEVDTGRPRGKESW